MQRASDLHRSRISEAWRERTAGRSRRFCVGHRGGGIQARAWRSALPEERAVATDAGISARTRTTAARRGGLGRALVVSDADSSRSQTRPLPDAVRPATLRRNGRQASLVLAERRAGANTRKIGRAHV